MAVRLAEILDFLWKTLVAILSIPLRVYAGVLCGAFGFWLFRMADTEGTRRMFAALGVPMPIVYLVVVVLCVLIGMGMITPKSPYNRR